MPINYFAILICGVIALVFGALWYGPLFGKHWMRIIGVHSKSIEEHKRMKKNAGPLFGVQFVLTIIQAYVLAYLISSWPGTDGVELALFLWVGFVMTTIAQNAMWNNDHHKIAWGRFLIQSGFQFTLFAFFGYILTVWR